MAGYKLLSLDRGLDFKGPVIDSPRFDQIFTISIGIHSSHGEFAELIGFAGQFMA